MCGAEATKRCSRCQNEWYCRRWDTIMSIQCTLYNSETHTVMWLQYCRFLIKREGLISAKNCEKHILNEKLRILKYWAYFSGRYKLNGTMIKIRHSGFYVPCDLIQDVWITELSFHVKKKRNLQYHITLKHNHVMWL